MTVDAASTRSAGPARGGTAPPDINAETYPFEVVQRLLDQAAYFNLFSIPAGGRGNAAVAPVGRPSAITAFRVNEMLCGFSVHLEPPRESRPLSAVNLLGDPIGRFDQRWVLIPDDYRARPDRIPPSTALDPTQRQRFVMLDARCTFGGNDGFRGFGTGTTHPVIHNGRRELLASAVGTLLEGYGRFQGLEGTYTYCGALSSETGFRGNVVLRVMDPRSALGSRARGDELAGTPLDPGETYVIFRGEKASRADRTAYRKDATGRIIGLAVAQRLRALETESVAGRTGAVDTHTEFGPVIGRMTADIDFDLQNPGPGTAISPAPFQSLNKFTFEDADGDAIGGVTVDGNEGRTFLLALPDAPGQAALRFGGFGPIVDGTGALSGVTGLMTDNSVVGLAPHALATSYVLRLDDPDGRYRAEDGI
jgi:hypothetical protein